MLDEIKEKMLYQIFMDVDDFCLELGKFLQGRCLSTQTAKRYMPQCLMSESEIVALLIFYHYSGYKCFQYYYENLVQRDLRSFFPALVSYNRFIELIPRCFLSTYLFTQFCCLRAKREGIYFSDSKKLPVCHNKRIHSHRVFQDIARRGKTSTGWFYGLKLHLVVNRFGEVVQFLITAGNVADNAKAVLDKLFKDLKGKCFGDKGYLTRFFEYFYEKGLQIITRLRTNMKNKLMDISDSLLLRKRALIESINDILMTVFDIDHSRHRSAKNAIVHLLAGLSAYAYYPQKPTVFIPNALV